jgi:hypothetical protein
MSDLQGPTWCSHTRARETSVSAGAVAGIDEEDATALHVLVHHGTLAVSTPALTTRAIGGKYGLGNNGAGYADEARRRQEKRDEVAAERDEFRRLCMSRVEKSDATIQWCAMRQHEIDREEDRLDRNEDRDDE